MRGLSRLAVVIVALFVAVAAYPVQSYADKPTYAKAYPAWTDLMKWADHTYVCYKGSRERCFAQVGGSSGGKELADTRGTGDTDYVSCVYDEGKKPMGICYYRYMIDGVCHQETNIGLGDAGTTVRKAKGYSISSKYFYTYGLNPNVGKCVSTCLKR